MTSKVASHNLMDKSASSAELEKLLTDLNSYAKEFIPERNLWNFRPSAFYFERIATIKKMNNFLDLTKDQDDLEGDVLLQKLYEIQSLVETFYCDIKSSLHYNICVYIVKLCCKTPESMNSNMLTPDNAENQSDEVLTRLNELRANLLSCHIEVTNTLHIIMLSDMKLSRKFVLISTTSAISNHSSDFLVTKIRLASLMPPM
jgi:hypothetical protein